MGFLFLVPVRTVHKPLILVDLLECKGRGSGGGAPTPAARMKTEPIDPVLAWAPMRVSLCITVSSPLHAEAHTLPMARNANRHILWQWPCTSAYTGSAHQRTYSALLEAPPPPPQTVYGSTAYAHWPSSTAGRADECGAGPRRGMSEGEYQTRCARGACAVRVLGLFRRPFHPEPIRGNGNASRAHQVPFTTPLPVDHLRGKLFKYLTRCGRGARAVHTRCGYSP